MKVTVVGLGTVGLVAAAALAHSGHKVLGIDIDGEKVYQLQMSKSPIYEPGLEELLKDGLESGKLSFVTWENVKNNLGEVIFIAVGTPPLPTGAADLSQVKQALEGVLEISREPAVIVMKSTVPPSTGRGLVAQYLISKPFPYISNPEFLRQGQAVKDWFQPDRIIIGGDNPKAIELMRVLYQNIKAPLVVTDITSAEMIKYAANAFLATKISFINEIANLCSQTGASIDDITQGIALDPRIGSEFLRAGLGYGGSCFPKEVRALNFFGTVSGYSPELLRAVIEVNNRQRFLPFQILRQRLGALTGKQITILGLAFKPHTDDLREAPALDLIRLLAEEGAQVIACDPIAVEKAKLLLSSQVRLTPDPMAALSGSEAAVLVTEWPEFISLDWQKAAQAMLPPKFIFDGRNALDNQLMLSLGFEYHGVGRKT